MLSLCPIFITVTITGTLQNMIVYYRSTGTVKNNKLVEIPVKVRTLIRDNQY